MVACIGQSRRLAARSLTNPVTGSREGGQQESAEEDFLEKRAKVTPKPKSSHAASGVRNILSIGASLGREAGFVDDGEHEACPAVAKRRWR